jgi:hypothetical protein
MPFELPSSLASLLSLFRPCFTQPSFQTFCVLLTGCLTRVRAHTVTGMLIAAGLAGRWHHARAHRFFSRARWSVDRLGLRLLELITERLLAAGEPLCVAIDDTLLRRFGPKVFGRQAHYDPLAPRAPRARRVAFGNGWVVAGVVVRLSFLERALCLPVLFRLWRPGQTGTQLELAAELIALIASAQPGRRLIVLVDGAYAGAALAPAKLPEQVTVIARVRRDIRLHAPAPPRRKGQMGRPRSKGRPLASVREQAAAGGPWHKARVEAYGQSKTAEFFQQRGLWYRAWGPAAVKVVALRDPDAADQLEMVLISSDPKLKAPEIIELYARRWSIEVAFRDAKQHVGVGEAQSRTRLAVERTAPFAFLCLTVAVLWYALAGHCDHDVARRRRGTPWNLTKRSPSVLDMLVKLRRTIIAARLSDALGAQTDSTKVAAMAEAWEMAAA